QLVLGAAAIIGRVVPYRLVQAVTTLPEEHVVTALDLACRVRLLLDDAPGQHRFAHDVIREVLEADLGSGQRMLLHRGVGQALEGLPEHNRRAAELAWHFLEADDAERALHYSLLAGDAAEGVFAHEEAERHYLTAAGLAAELRDALREAEAREKLGRV